MSAEVASPAPGALHGRVVKGVAWKAASGVFNQLMRLLVAATLAHLLSPHDYGLAGMVLVFSSLVLVFSDLALGTALVQREIITEEDRSTVFWTVAAGGVLFTGLGVASAGLVAGFYGEPEVAPLFAALSLGFLVNSLAGVHTALLTRDMAFRSLELRQMGASLAGGVVGVSLALAGKGAWAIIAQQLTVLAMSTVLLWILCPWRPRLLWSWRSLRGMAGYGGNVLGSRLLFFFNRNLDNALIGRYLGAAALGAYAVAYNLMLVPLSQISLPLQEVLFPAFSRLQEQKDRMISAYLRANRVIGAISIPGMLGLVAVAPDFVAVVLGPRWESAVDVIRVLAWVGLMQSLQGLNGTVLRALDRTGTLLRYSVVVLVASVAAFVIGLPHGIVGVAVAYAVMSTIVEPYYTWLTARAMGMPLWRYPKALAGVTASALIMLPCVIGGRALMLEAGLPAGPRLILSIGVGIVVFGLAAMRLAPELRGEALQLLRRRSA
jgi:O-antigen/teichoic acid export membrane protein